MVEVGTGSVGTRFIETDWPNEEGLTAGTTKQTGRKMTLVPTHGSFIPKRKKIGL